MRSWRDKRQKSIVCESSSCYPSCMLYSFTAFARVNVIWCMARLWTL